MRHANEKYHQRECLYVTREAQLIKERSFLRLFWLFFAGEAAVHKEHAGKEQRRANIPLEGKRVAENEVAQKCLVKRGKKKDSEYSSSSFFFLFLLAGEIYEKRTVKKRLAALLMTVTTADDGESARDVVKSAHMSTLQTTMSAAKTKRETASACANIA